MAQRIPQHVAISLLPTISQDLSAGDTKKNPKNAKKSERHN
jgi:hypothetical protein